MPVLSDTIREKERLAAGKYCITGWLTIHQSANESEYFLLKIVCVNKITTQESKDENKLLYIGVDSASVDDNLWTWGTGWRHSDKRCRHGMARNRVDAPLPIVRIQYM